MPSGKGHFWAPRQCHEYVHDTYSTKVSTIKECCASCKSHLICLRVSERWGRQERGNLAIWWLKMECWRTENKCSVERIHVHFYSSVLLKTTCKGEADGIEEMGVSQWFQSVMKLLFQDIVWKSVTVQRKPLNCTVGRVWLSGEE